MLFYISVSLSAGRDGRTEGGRADVEAVGVLLEWGIFGYILPRENT